MNVDELIEVTTGAEHRCTVLGRWEWVVPR
jgi:hypothetical protein